jgi:ABC-type multidrug transport system permease subunit
VGSIAGFLRAAIAKDVARRLNDPGSLAIWLGMPLVLGTLITLVSGGSGGPKPRAKVLIVDQDDSVASRLLKGVFQQGPAEGLFEGKTVNPDEGERLIQAGKASALLTIPKGFGDALFLEHPCELQLVTNPAQRILPGIVEETLRAACDLAFYGQRLIGPQVQLIRASAELDRAPTRDEVSEVSIQIRDALDRVGDLVFPPVLELKPEPFEPKAADVPEPSVGSVILPGILLMALLFIAQGSSEDLWEEHQRGTLKRAATSPVALAAWLLAKLGACTVLMFAVGVLAGTIAIALLGFDPLRTVAGIAWATLAAATFGVLMLLLQSLAKSRRGASVLGMLVLFPLLMLGGSFFPFAAMPEGLARIGRLTPNGIALVQLQNLLDGTAETRGLLTAAAVLVGTSLPLFALLVLRVRRAFVQA